MTVTTYHTIEPKQLQVKWYYAYLIDDFPQQLPEDNANGYTGPFDTEREAWVSLYGEMDARIAEYENTNRVVAKGLKAIADYALPVSGGAA